MITLTYLLFQHVLFIQHFVMRIIYVDTHGLRCVLSLQYSVTLYEQFIHYPVVGHLSCFHFSVITNRQVVSTFQWLQTVLLGTFIIDTSLYVCFCFVIPGSKSSWVNNVYT